MTHKTSLQIVLNLLTLVAFLSSTASYFNTFKVSEVLAQAVDENDRKVKICHSSSSHDNPYIVQHPDKSGDVSGHDDHNGPIWYSGIPCSLPISNCWGDIIPPFDYDDGQHYNGKNWTSEGQSIWNNSCNIAATTPTTPPTPTPTIILPTENPTPTFTITPTPTSGSLTEDPTPTQRPTPITDPGDPTSTPIINPTPTPTSASNVGGDPGNSGGNSDSNNSPVCNDSRPGAPTGLTVSWISSTQVRLTWNHAVGSHTSYLIAYGPNTESFPWGNPNVGNENTYTVGSLVPGAQYCFYVQAQNGCSPGDKSSVVCTNRGSTVRILGATDNYNPLVDGVRLSYNGSVLGATTLAKTGTTSESKIKLPSGNVLLPNLFLSIPKLKINSQIYQGQSIGQELVVGDREILAVDYNNSTLLYGHNQMSVFGRLHQLRSGDSIGLMKDNQTLNYQVVEVKMIADTDIGALNITNPNYIYLLTCSYLQPDKRWLVIAKLN